MVDAFPLDDIIVFMKNKNKFVIVADDEVIMHFVVHRDNDGVTDGIIAGLRSNPKILELSQEDDPSVGFGWRYVGGKFVSPESSFPYSDDYEVD